MKTSATEFSLSRRRVLAIAGALSVTGCVRSQDGVRLRRFDNPFELSRDLVLDAYHAAGGAPQATFGQMSLKRPDGRMIPVRLAVPTAAEIGLGLLVLSPDGATPGSALDPLAGILAASGWLVATPTHSRSARDTVGDHQNRLSDIRFILDSTDALIAGGGPMAFRLDREIMAVAGIGSGGIAALNVGGALLPNGRSVRDGRVLAAISINQPLDPLLATPVSARSLAVPALIVSGGGVTNLEAFQAIPAGLATALLLDGPDASFGGSLGPVAAAPTLRVPTRQPPASARRLAQLRATGAVASVFLTAKARRRSEADAALKAANGRVLEGLDRPLDIRQR